MKAENQKLMGDLKCCETEIKEIKQSMQVNEDEEKAKIEEFKQRFDHAEKQNKEVHEVNIKISEENKALEERYQTLLDKLTEMEKAHTQTEDICLQQAEEIDYLTQSKGDAEALLLQWKIQFEDQKNENIKLQSTVDGLSIDLQSMSHQMLDLSQSIYKS